MPLYEYLCDACGHRFELIRKYADPPLEVCPVCGGAVQKLLSSPAIQFKGSGWYITDYARAGKGDGKSDGKGEPAASKGGSDAGGGGSTPAKSDAAGESKTETKAEGKGDSKSEAKSESKPSSSTST